MTLKRLRLLLAGSVLTFGIFYCASGTDDSSLTLQSFPPTLALDSTIGPFTAVKKVRNTGGRLQTTPDYTGFYLVSDDSTIARIVSECSVIGLKIGTTTITAKDKNSSLSSDKYAIQVTPM